MDNELMEKLTQINIDSETALKISEAYFKYEYVSLFFGVLFGFAFLALVSYLVFQIIKDMRG